MILPYLMVAAIYGTAALYHARRRVEAGTNRGAIPEGDAHHTTRPMRARRLLQPISDRWQAALGHLPIRSQWIGLLVIAWLLASSFWNIAATSARVLPFWMVGSHPNPQEAQINALLARVPPTASVAATDTLNPHLSDRYTLFLLPDPQSYMADYVAIDVSADVSTNRPADQEMYEAMLTSGNYLIIGTAGQVVLLQRLSLSIPALRAPTPATEQVHPQPVQGSGTPNTRR